MNTQLPTIPKKQFSYVDKITKTRYTMVPFTQGQQAILLEAGDAVTDKTDDSKILSIIKDKLEAVKQVVTECIVSPDVNAGSLPLYVVEEMYLALRSKSIGEDMVLEYTCNNQVEDVRCGNKIKHRVDVSKVAAGIDGDITKVFVVADGEQPIGISFKYLTIDNMIQAMEDNIAEAHLLMIDSIFEGDQVYDAAQCSVDTLRQFFNDIPADKSAEIKTRFFDCIPTIEYSADVVCDKCGFVHRLKLKGLNDFFQ